MSILIDEIPATIPTAKKNSNVFSDSMKKRSWKLVDRITPSNLDYVEKFPGFFSIEYTKSMESLHGIAPWVSRIFMKSTLGDSMRKNPGNLFIECPQQISILWDLVYGHHSSSQLMIFQISNTKMDQKCVPDPMGWTPGPEICKEWEIWEEIFKKLGLGTDFLVFKLIFDRFRHF